MPRSAADLADPARSEPLRLTAYRLQSARRWRRPATLGPRGATRRDAPAVNTLCPVRSPTSAAGSIRHCDKLDPTRPVIVLARNGVRRTSWGVVKPYVPLIVGPCSHAAAAAVCISAAVGLFRPRAPSGDDPSLWRPRATSSTVPRCRRLLHPRVGGQAGTRALNRMRAEPRQFFQTDTRRKTAGLGRGASSDVLPGQTSAA